MNIVPKGHLENFLVISHDDAHVAVAFPGEGHDERVIARVEHVAVCVGAIGHHHHGMAAGASMWALH